MATIPESFTFTVPSIPLPYLSGSEPLVITIHRTQLQTLLRLIVVISTYMLFRPHLEKLFRTMMGNGDPTGDQVQARVAKIEQERGVPIGGGKRVIAVATPGGAGGAGAGAGAGQVTGSAAKGNSRSRKKA